ncbi:MAG: efflux RND transporter periplasmic adaptor subunit [Polyangiaceae bacterium]|nr:efflux RND transporter periplasmic adaptor subunit [Myxococcales bacterium]MCB9587486.1 efflux RND transporter periplasmic adaptor subunit [Polyangiaceae bacterium]MCB9605717.1 efflux RND transporter periplasmic adaptor subunit [Polyangiaceae bacterium]
MPKASPLPAEHPTKQRLIGCLFVPLAIIALSIGGLIVLSQLRQAANRQKPAPQIPLVQVVTSRTETLPAHVSATGTVEAAKELTLSPEVTGRVTYVSPNLVTGGRVKQGETLLRIDASSYALQARQQKTAIRKAEADLRMEAGRQEIAKQEWELVGDGTPPDEAELALRKPQMDAVKSGLDSAKTGLRQAQLNLSRTTIRAPMNAIVVAEHVEKGQVVAPGIQIGSLMGVEQFWVRVSVPVALLDDLQIPGLQGEEGSEARVIQRLGGERNLERKGRVLRLLGQLDAKTRTAQLLIAVDSPLEKPESGSPVPILPGAYVEVDIQGRALKGVTKLPRSALTGGDSVWIVDKDHRLAKRRVAVRWSGDNDVYVGGELKDGDRVVVSPMTLPLPGQQVKVEGDPDTKPAGSAAPGAVPQQAGGAKE